MVGWLVGANHPLELGGLVGTLGALLGVVNATRKNKSVIVLRTLLCREPKVNDNIKN